MDQIIARLPDVLDQLPQGRDLFLFLGIAVGGLLLWTGIASIVGERNPAADRITAGTGGRREARRDRGLLMEAVRGTHGLIRPIMPTDERSVTELRRRLQQAGYSNPAAARNYMMVRVLLAVLTPAIVIAMITASQSPAIDVPLLDARFSAFTALDTARWIVCAVALAYFAPVVWLNGRITERQQRISEAFPNALDLLQVSVEAGLGFDAAMTRVGNEMVDVAPDIAFEFLSVQHQVQAGRPREQALRAMADRTGVDVVRSFANVVHQSMQFGTSMSEALTNYAREMRVFRELKAQEMANKLPVKMSAVLASLMLPALIMIAIGPTVIRYMRMF